MPSTRKRRRALALVAGAVLVAAIAALAATVSVQRANEPATRGVAGAQPTAAGGTRGAQAQTLFVDPATGLPRDPTPEELQALQKVTTDTSPPPEPTYSVTGAPGLILTDEQMTYTVATKNPDGTVTVEHAGGRNEADRLVRKRTSRGGLRAGKEQRDDR